MRPINAYLPTAQEVVTLDHYEFALRDRCNAAHGIEGKFQISPQLNSYVTAIVQDQVLRNPLYGLFDAAGAEVRGYHPKIAGALTVLGPRGVTATVIRACTRQVENTFSGGSALSYVDPGVLPDGGPASAGGDSRYLAAVGRWASCMKGQGYSFVDPTEAMEHYFESPAATSEEISTAVTDTRCKVTTNLMGVEVAVQSALDQRYINGHVVQLAGFTTSLERLLRTAAEAG